MKELNVARSQMVNVERTLDDSALGHEVPTELKMIFAQEPNMESRFNALSPCKQRTILCYINQVKDPYKRADRYWLFMRNLMSIAPGKETMRLCMDKE